MKKITLIFVSLLILQTSFAFAQTKREIYAIAKSPTPVFYSPNLASIFGGASGTTLKLDAYGEIDELEMIALPNTVFRVLGAIKKGKNTILKVETNDYPYQNDTGYYIDARYVSLTTKKPQDRQKVLPNKNTIIARMKQASGSAYTWGGNYYTGVPSLLRYYAPAEKISSALEAQWKLAGTDCSGLLYQATDGYTPRNTSSLLTYGTSVAIVGKTSEEIRESLRPLDLIVWSGHVMIVINKTQLIESRLDYEPEKEGFQWGVRIKTIKEVLDDALAKKTPVNNIADSAPEGKKKFVIRRWYDIEANK